MIDRRTSELLAPLAKAHEAHHGFLRRRLAVLGVPDDALDDAVQDVFLVLVRRIRDYDPRFGIRQWMSGVARRVAKRYRRQSPHDPAIDPDRIPSEILSPEDAARVHEARRVLDEFLGSLDAEKWAVFVFAEIEGLPGVEIAAELEININTVYARLRATRSAFAAAVKRHRARERRGAAWLFAPFEALRPWSNPGPLTIAAFVQIRTAMALALAVVLGAVAWWMVRTHETVNEPANIDRAGQAQTDTPGGPSRVAAAPRDLEFDGVSTAAIHGLVRDEQGRPIAGATVCVQTRAADVSTLVQRQPVCAVSGRDGRYGIRGLFPIDYSVSASARGFRPAQYLNPEASKPRRWILRLEPGEVRDSVDVALARGGALVRGTVRDLAGGPVAGAWVRVYAGHMLSGESTFAACETEGDGTFECWSSPGRVVVFASADGYTEAWDRGAAPGRGRELFFELFLTPASTLTGQVVLGDGGEPVAGARIVARLNDRGGRPVGQTSSEEDGSFRLTGLAPGTYKLEATTPELYGMSKESIHLGLAETSDTILVPAYPAFSVVGRVVVADADGEPCPLGSVLLEDPERNAGAWGPIEPDGSTLIRALQPGSYLVSVSCEGHVSAEDYPSVAIIDASVNDVTWAVTRGLTIRGSVVHADGTPVVGVDVWVRAVRSPSHPRKQLTNATSAPTDGVGAFEITGLLPGRYEILATGEAQQPPKTATKIELNEDGGLEGVRIEIVETGTIAGMVRNERGEPVVGVWVGALADLGGYPRVRTDDEGSYVLERVPAGAVRVRVEGMRAPDQRDDDEDGQQASVSAGETVRADLVVESHSGRITGRVTDAHGGPVSDAFVDVQRESDSVAAAPGSARRVLTTWWSSPRRDPLLADVDGRFAIGELADGTYTLRAYRPGGGEGVLEAVAVGSSVVVQLDTPGSLGGTVVVEGARRPDRFTLRATDTSTGVRLTDDFFRTDGKWRITNVPAGLYTIEVDAAGSGTASTSIELSSGEDKTDITLRLTETVTVTGRLVDLDSGQPVSGVRVSIGSRSGVVGFGDPVSHDKKEISDAGGRFEIEHAPAGSARLTAWTVGINDGAEYGLTRVPVVIPSGTDTHVLDPIALVERRLAKGQRSGSLGLQIERASPNQDPEDRQLMVASVRVGGPAASSGVVAGDEIVAVDGHDVRGTLAYRYPPLVRAPPGRVLELTLADDRVLEVKLGAPE